MQERKNDPRILNIPVVIITADDTTEQQVLTMELGASDYIVKPFIPEIVTRRVQNVWDSTRRKRSSAGASEVVDKQKNCVCFIQISVPCVTDQINHSCGSFVLRQTTENKTM